MAGLLIGGIDTHTWETGSVTLPIGGNNFRFAARPSLGGWVVAGESVTRAHDARGELLTVELVLGALLLVVTFAGSFIVGLRAWPRSSRSAGARPSSPPTPATSCAPRSASSRPRSTWPSGGHGTRPSTGSHSSA